MQGIKVIFVAALLTFARAAQIVAPLINAPVLRSANLVAEAPALNVPPLAQYADSAPIVAGKTAPAQIVEAEEIDARPEYNFFYAVQDNLSGDSKTHQESRYGDVVKGSYSLIEPDGSRRIVNYYADPIQGFNAVVQKDFPEPTAKTIVSRVAVSAKVISA